MRVFEKQIRHFKKIENMKENNRKMEKMCEKVWKKCQYYDRMRKKKKKIQDLLLKHEKYKLKNN